MAKILNPLIEIPNYAPLVDLLQKQITKDSQKQTFSRPSTKRITYSNPFDFERDVSGLDIGICFVFRHLHLIQHQ